MDRELEKEFLIRGTISKALIKLAIPIMATSFIEMTYNLVDMMWIGRIGGEEVTSVGTAGYFIWILISIGMITRIGAEVFVSQSFGRRDNENRLIYIRSSLQLGILIVLVYSLLVFIFSENLIGFFEIKSEKIIYDGIRYLRTIVMFMIFIKMNFVITGIFNAHGNSKTPFMLNAMGMIINMVLDPILIFGFGIIKPMGVVGAAVATGISHLIMTMGFMYAIYKDSNFKGVKIFSSISFKHIYQIFRKGLPVGLQSLMLASIGMVLAKIVAMYNFLAVGIQRVTGTIESISWRSASGFGSALTAFIGQNYGAKQYDRIKKAYLIGIRYVVYIGLFTTIAFVFFSRPIMSLFFYEPEILELGTVCLRIMGYSQIFMNIEIVTSASFSGIGRTTLPAFISITWNILRVPMALFLGGYMLLGLEGVWYSITLSANIKGILIGGIFVLQYYVFKKSF